MNDIAKLRTEKGIGQSTLSRLSGVSRHTIIRIENGGNTTIETLAKLHAALRKTIKRPCPHCGR